MWSSFGILLILNLLCCKFYGKILYVILRIQVNSVWFRHFGYSEIKNRNSFINYNTPPIVWSSFFFIFLKNDANIHVSIFDNINVVVSRKLKMLSTKLSVRRKLLFLVYIVYFKLQANPSIVAWEIMYTCKIWFRENAFKVFRVFFVIDEAFISM